MAATRQSGPGMLLPSLFPILNRLSVTNPNPLQGAGPVSLPAGAVELIPAGQWHVLPGPYSFAQVKDPVSGLWRTLGTRQEGLKAILSDGVNFRIANLSGCAVGAFITNVGSAYTSAPTVTASAGSSTWRAIVGGAINSTVAITTAGSGYTYPPILLIDPPPAGGVQATAICTLSAGVINAVTVINQGAGYTTAPSITVLPDPRDTGAIVTGVLTVNATLAGSGTVTAIVCTDHGTPLTSVPTLTISGGGGSSAAATVVMCFTVTAFTVAVNGAGYGNAQPMLVLSGGGIVAGTAGAVVNPSIGPGMFTPRQASISATSTAGGIIQTTGAVVNDGGLFQAVPTLFVLAGGTGLATTTAGATATVGGVTDTSQIYPA